MYIYIYMHGHGESNCSERDCFFPKRTKSFAGVSKDVFSDPPFPREKCRGVEIKSK